MKTLGHYTGRVASLLLTRILFLDRLESEPLEWSYLFFSQCICVLIPQLLTHRCPIIHNFCFFLFEIHLTSEVSGEDPVSS